MHDPLTKVASQYLQSPDPRWDAAEEPQPATSESTSHLFSPITLAFGGLFSTAWLELGQVPRFTLKWLTSLSVLAGLYYAAAVFITESSMEYAGVFAVLMFFVGASLPSIYLGFRALGWFLAAKVSRKDVKMGQAFRATLVGHTAAAPFFALCALSNAVHMQAPPTNPLTITAPAFDAYDALLVVTIAAGLIGAVLAESVTAGMVRDIEPSFRVVLVQTVAFALLTGALVACALHWMELTAYQHALFGYSF